jgi:hypothetical protein
MSQGTGQNMVYGDLNLGKFEEQVMGINLSKLFSVYVPGSKLGKKQKKSMAHTKMQQQPP